MSSAGAATAVLCRDRDRLLKIPFLPIVGDMREYLSSPHEFVLIPGVMMSNDGDGDDKHECFQFVIPSDEAHELWSPRSMADLMEFDVCKREIECVSYRHGGHGGLLSPKRHGRTRTRSRRSRSVPPMRRCSPQFRNEVLETRSPVAVD